MNPKLFIFSKSNLCKKAIKFVFEIQAAHTSAGKTVVAEYAVALCKLHRTRYAKNFKEIFLLRSF